MPSPVILILGAGPNIGHHVAKTFAASGYKVAVAARSVKEAESTDSQLNIPSDFTKSDDVVNAFSKVKKVFGIPSVVVYNGKPLVLPCPALPCPAFIPSTNTNKPPPPQSAPRRARPPTTRSPSPSPISAKISASMLRVSTSPRNRPSPASRSCPRARRGRSS